ncbi:putative monooxygenase [Streptomyces sp. NBRC 110611]|uniref:FAD-dependent monooxygenase n=1 Tax=Streptomyces sp. NBRC 110611 TaxID=1621259 RepID=UPI00082D5951|nr:FAD-dependent monooxygenase [Streptomyces sp. NBRC 110611]GAU66469.1 putative monooxygenase [Streptomyces sp. NBRC 110611]
MQAVLISGGGIAGPVLAYWLHRHGFAPTVVERAPGPRPGGQAVDIRGVALDVIERMGLLEPAQHVRTRMRGMSVLAPDGHEIERSTETAWSSGRLDTDDIELLREDLVRMVYDHTLADVEYLFGNSITALDENENGVHVDFAHGASRTFDLVIGADGLRSTVRRLVFGPEDHFAHHLGSYLSVFSADNFLSLDHWQLWLRDGDAGFCIMPVRDNTELRIAFGFESPPLAGHLRDTGALRQHVAGRLAALTWEGARLAEAARNAPDFYCDAMAQIRMDRWSLGRVALLGDAGWCPSPLSGQGTSLALVGAHVLADCLARAHGDHHAAYARYEHRMRPFVTLNQSLATENPGGPPAEASLTHAKNALRLDT